MLNIETIISLHSLENRSLELWYLKLKFIDFNFRLKSAENLKISDFLPESKAMALVFLPKNDLN